MNRRLTILPLLAAATFALAACGGSTTPISPPATGGNGTVSSAPGSSDPLASINPCALLSQTQVSQNGLNPEGPSNAAGARVCTWQRPNSPKDGYSVEFDIRDHQGIDQVNTAGATVTEGKSADGKHEEKLTAGGGGLDGCALTIGVTSSSRIDVNVDAAGIEQSCQVAKQFEAIIEPELPSGGH